MPASYVAQPPHRHRHRCAGSPQSVHQRSHRSHQSRQQMQALRTARAAHVRKPWVQGKTEGRCIERLGEPARSDWLPGRVGIDMVPPGAAAWVAGCSVTPPSIMLDHARSSAGCWAATLDAMFSLSRSRCSKTEPAHWPQGSKSTLGNLARRGSTEAHASGGERRELPHFRRGDELRTSGLDSARAMLRAN